MRLSQTLCTGLAWFLLLGVALPAASRTTATTPDKTSSDPSKNVVGHIDGKAVTETDLVAPDRDAFTALDDDYAARLRGLQAKHEQDRYDLLKDKLDKLLDKRAVELEAQERHTDTATVLRDLVVPVVTDDEAKAYYEANKDKTTQTFDQLKGRIIQFLAANNNTTATRAFYDKLRARHNVSDDLPPYRVAVAATGPTKGRTDAPVTIVEFADFQCPYCREAEATIRKVVSTHSDSVRLVFRNLPLTNVHPNALTAAVAGVCADHQGKFWQMHDAMFDNQDELAEPDLKATAKKLGLDEQNFAACLADPKSKAAVDFDARAADALSLDGTPSFFINGRPLFGNLPAEQIESVVAEELQRSSNRRG
jgi:protein-disulfide isomerase